jgi:TP901 family phage tail tape measure protein
VAGELRASLRLGLRDGLSGGLGRLLRLFDRLDRLGRRLGLGGMANGDRALNRASGAADRLIGRLERIRQRATSAFAALTRMFAAQGRGGAGGAGGLGGVAAAAGALGAGSMLASRARPAASYEQTLRDIAMTGADPEANGRARPGAEVVAEVNRSIEEMRGRFNALATETGQSSRNVAAAAGRMVAAGFDPALVERLLPTTARVATAANASISDIAEMAISMNRQLGVTAEQMERAFAIAIRSGQLGRVELRNMASEFPALAANANAFGLRGLGGLGQLTAGLQITERGAATPAQAADNLRDLMLKSESDEVAKNFSERGIDIRGILGTARRRNEQVRTHNADPANAGRQRQEIDLLSVLAQTIQRATRGDSSQVARIFTDLQAQSGALQLLRFSQDQGETRGYRTIRDTSGRAEVSMVQRMTGQNLAGAEFQLAIFDERMAQLGDRIGQAFLRSLPLVSAGLEQLLAVVGRFDAEHPGMLDNLAAWGGTALIVVAAISLLAVAGGFLGRGLRLVWIGARAVWGGLRLLNTVLRPVWMLAQALLIPVRLLALAFGLVASPALAMGAAIVAVGALIAGAALTIYARWDEFAPYFRALWEAVRGIFRGAWEFVAGVFTGDWERAGLGASAVWEGVQAALGATWEIIKGVFRIAGEEIGRWADTGWRNALDRLTSAWESVSGLFNTAVEGAVCPASNWRVGRTRKACRATRSARKDRPGRVQRAAARWAGETSTAP